MTLRKKLQAAATSAAQEAAMRERGRCLWILADMLEQTASGLRTKVLIERERQIAQVKLAIMESLVLRLRARIVSGAGPSTKAGETTLREDYIECEECFAQGTMYHEGRRLCQDCFQSERIK